MRAILFTKQILGAQKKLQEADCSLFVHNSKRSQLTIQLQKDLCDQMGKEQHQVKHPASEANVGSSP